MTRWTTLRKGPPQQLPPPYLLSCQAKGLTKIPVQYSLEGNFTHLKNILWRCTFIAQFYIPFSEFSIWSVKVKIYQPEVRIDQKHCYKLVLNRRSLMKVFLHSLKHWCKYWTISWTLTVFLGTNMSFQNWLFTYINYILNLISLITDISDKSRFQTFINHIKWPTQISSFDLHSSEYCVKYRQGLSFLPKALYSLFPFTPFSFMAAELWCSLLPNLICLSNVINSWPSIILTSASWKQMNRLTLTSQQILNIVIIIS